MAWMIVAWVYALIAAIGFKALTGRINLRGLLSDSHGNFSPERAQLMIATLASVTTYAQDAIASGAMVDPSTVTLSGIAGSQTLYVVGKYVRQLMATAQQTKEGA
jgi:hypothetical protein